MRTDLPAADAQKLLRDDEEALAKFTAVADFVLPPAAAMARTSLVVLAKQWEYQKLISPEKIGRGFIELGRFVGRADAADEGDVGSPLLLEATGGVTIALVSSRERKWRQPGLATDDPAFVGWHQLVRGIQASQVHFDFVCAAPEHGRAAAGTEKPPGIVACFAVDGHRIPREHRGSVKKSAMMLTAVETVAKADPVWDSRRHNSDVAA
jgi:hypothetical protein